MKKVIALIVLLACVSFPAFAENDDSDGVYEYDNTPYQADYYLPEIPERDDDKMLKAAMKLTELFLEGQKLFDEKKYEKALEKYFFIDSQLKISLASLEIARVYVKMKKSDMAMKYFDEAIKIAETTGFKDPWMMKEIYIGKMDSSFTLREYQKAVDASGYAMHYAREEGDFKTLRGLKNLHEVFMGYVADEKNHNLAMWINFYDLNPLLEKK